MKVIEIERDGRTVLYAPDRRVLLWLYCVLTGRTEKSVRKKIENGSWIEGREYHRDPDGSIVVDRQRADQWVTG